MIKNGRGLTLPVCAIFGFLAFEKKTFDNYAEKNKRIILTILGLNAIIYNWMCS